MNYPFTFATIGGNTRVRIQSGEDIRHLNELDQKMWTVLSCPVTGLEISSDSLSLMDLDGDGIIEGALVGGESVDIRATAAVWCCGKDGVIERYSVGVKKDDAYSWSHGQTQGVK